MDFSDGEPMDVDKDPETPKEEPPVEKNEHRKPQPSTSVQSQHHNAEQYLNYLDIQHLPGINLQLISSDVILLNGISVYDWGALVKIINKHPRKVKLDMRGMALPMANFSAWFWKQFLNAMDKAFNLYHIILYRCPVGIVKGILQVAPHLEIIDASTISCIESCSGDVMLNLEIGGICKMSTLRKLRLRGTLKIDLQTLPSFAKLVHLTHLSITSVEAFPKNFYRALMTVTTNLETLEVGNCHCLNKDFAVPLRHFVKLKSLRLENMYDRWDNAAHDVFSAIRGLKHLVALEIVNIKLSERIKEEITKCTNIKAMLIIPYGRQNGVCLFRLIECIHVLRNSLTHLGFVITNEMMDRTNMFINACRARSLNYNVKYDIHPEVDEKLKYIPLQIPVDPSMITVEKLICLKQGFKLVTIQEFDRVIKVILKKVHSKMIIVPYSDTTSVSLEEEFDNL